MRCSTDLRQRVVEFVRGGSSRTEAARRFKVGEASMYRWLKPRRPDLPASRPSPAPQAGLGAVTLSCGGPSRLDASGTGTAFPSLPALYLERAAQVGGGP
ncbi:MAG: hypothetical protein JSR29_00500 [Nitrospira sp.]|nr:hypothetical protein [Nitrospira sp.]